MSLGLNVYFFVRKMERLERNDEVIKLNFYKDITHQEGYEYFLKQIKSNYPEANISEKYFIVYMWDSTMYDFMYKDQMKVLDSMAAGFGKYKLEYVFATEMEELASKSFLSRNYDEFKNVRMLYGMDDFISGLYSIKDIKIRRPKLIGGSSPGKMKENCGIEILKSKQKPFYLIMDSNGKVLYTNQNIFMILKDTTFLNKLNVLVPDKSMKILN